MTENTNVLRRSVASADFVVSYGPHPEQVADIRLPPHTEFLAPLLLLWHGGFWRAGHERSEVAPMAAALAAIGFAVASVEYRATGAAGGWLTTLSDVANAADAVPPLVENIAPGRIDHNRIIYGGHSAGGQLATWAALRDRLPPGVPGSTQVPLKVRGVLGLAPVLDLIAAYELGSGDSAVASFLGGSPTQHPDRYAAADPMLLGNLVTPMVIVHGARDSLVPVSMSRRYVASATCRLIEVADADHFAVIDPESSAWPTVLNALLSLTDETNNEVQCDIAKNGLLRTREQPMSGDIRL